MRRIITLALFTCVLTCSIAQECPDLSIKEDSYTFGGIQGELGLLDYSQDIISDGFEPTIFIGHRNTWSETIISVNPFKGGEIAFAGNIPVNVQETFFFYPGILYRNGIRPNDMPREGQGSVFLGLKYRIKYFESDFRIRYDVISNTFYWSVRTSIPLFYEY